MADIIATAVMIGSVAHKAIGQVRKYTGEEYMSHPRAVSKIVMDYTDCEYTIAAALLHDVIEDTHITEQDLFNYLHLSHSAYEAHQVVDLVMEVTKVSVPTDGVRKVRRRLDHEHYAGGSSKAQLIKAADSLHNCLSIVDGDAKFAERYIPEKRELADMLDLAPEKLIKQLHGVLDSQEIQLTNKE